MVAVVGFWAIASMIFLAGRWYLPAAYPAILLERAAAQVPSDGQPGSSDNLTLLRGQLAALGEPGAAVVIAGAVELQDVLANVEPLSDPCFGCLQQIAGDPREYRDGDPTQVAVRYWQGSTVLSITAQGAAIDQPIGDLRVSLNAGGKVYFGRECTMTMERSRHAVYRTAVEGESIELLELLSFGGRLECAVVENSTTGEAVSLVAVFSYALPGH